MMRKIEGFEMFIGVAFVFVNVLLIKYALSAAFFHKLIPSVVQVTLLTWLTYYVNKKIGNTAAFIAAVTVVSFLANIFSVCS